MAKLKRRKRPDKREGLLPEPEEQTCWTCGGPHPKADIEGGLLLVPWDQVAFDFKVQGVRQQYSRDALRGRGLDQMVKNNDQNVRARVHGKRLRHDDIDWEGYAPDPVPLY
jgi:hypothetical protein